MDKEISEYQFIIASPFFAGMGPNNQTERDKFWNLFQSLPPAIKQSLASDETAAYILGLGQQFNLEDDQISSIASLVRGVLLGEVFIKDLPNLILTKTLVNSETATKIADGLAANIFSLVVDDLRKVQMSKFGARLGQEASQTKPSTPSGFGTPPKQQAPPAQQMPPRPQFRQPQTQVPPSRPQPQAPQMIRPQAPQPQMSSRPPVQNPVPRPAMPQPPNQMPSRPQFSQPAPMPPRPPAPQPQMPARSSIPQMPPLPITPQPQQFQPPQPRTSPEPKPQQSPSLPTTQGQPKPSQNEPKTFRVIDLSQLDK